MCVSVWNYVESTIDTGEKERGSKRSPPPADYRTLCFIAVLSGLSLFTFLLLVLLLPRSLSLFNGHGNHYL